MAVTALPDLNVLPAEELRALILAQHEQLVSAEDKLTTTQEQLLSREREIEHLKLLLVKLHRMQFGRKSEKLARQIEQLELRLEELESNRSEKESTPPEPVEKMARGLVLNAPERKQLYAHGIYLTHHFWGKHPETPQEGGFGGILKRGYFGKGHAHF